MLRIASWLWFVVVQVGMLVAGILGLVVLILPCLLQAWTADRKSIKDGRQIDRWKLKPLNWIWGNPEDGVSGQTALVWLTPSQKVPIFGQK